MNNKEKIIKKNNRRVDVNFLKFKQEEQYTRTYFVIYNIAQNQSFVQIGIG